MTHNRLISRENNNSKCIFCNVSTSYRLTDDNSFIVCDECQMTHNLFARTFCINNLLLNKRDLNTLKCFHKSNKKLYLESDIQKLIVIKYGNDHLNYETYKDKKLLQKYTKLSNINIQRELRKTQLMEKLAEYKLECKNYGDCYSYIQFGYPDVNTVIGNELEKYRNIFSKQQCEICSSNLNIYDKKYVDNIIDIGEDNTIYF